MKKITDEQIGSVLNLVYQLNVTAKVFDELKQFFNALPLVEESCGESCEEKLTVVPKE